MAFDLKVKHRYFQKEDKAIKTNEIRGTESLNPMSPDDVPKLSPERVRIAKIFKKYIDRAIEELGVGYDVTVQGRFDKKPIRLEIEVTTKEEIP